MPSTRTFGEVTRQELLDAGEAMELSAAISKRELDRLVRTLPRELAALAQELERMAAALADGPALPFLAGQRRLVNAMRHVVVADHAGPHVKPEAPGKATVVSTRFHAVS